MQSHSIQIKPLDSRCRYWAKIVRAGKGLRVPSLIMGANDIGGSYLQVGEEELLPGDSLFEGEANHHSRNDRGWSYWLAFVSESGELVRYVSGFSAQKAEMKAQGLSPELLTGSGDIAAMVRIVHGLRAGLSVTPSTTE
jgi:hypothetical protein